jgi:hypothetical protein
MAWRTKVFQGGIAAGHFTAGEGAHPAAAAAAAAAAAQLDDDDDYEVVVVVVVVEVVSLRPACLGAPPYFSSCHAGEL